MLVAAGISPQERGEALTVAEFAAIAAAVSFDTISPPAAQTEEVDQ